jgi:hypothetical protein
MLSTAPWAAASRNAAVVSLWVLLVTTSTGCSNSAAEQAAPYLFSHHFAVVDSLELYEDADAIVVLPNVSVDRDAYLIADPREVRVRIYEPDGRLRSQFGTKGFGPGEMQMPQTALRHPSGRILVVDLVRGILEFEETGAEVIREFRLPVRSYYGASIISDSLVLVGGMSPERDSSGRSKLLHIWNIDRDAVVQSFFWTPGGDPMVRAAQSYGYVSWDFIGDTIVAAFSLTDTLYFFGLDGVELDRKRIPFQTFTAIEQFDMQELSDPRKRTSWESERIFLQGVFVMPNGDLLIQYERPNGTDSEWNLLGMTRQGERLFELHGTPKLLATDGRLLYFTHPESIAPNKWIVARDERS